MVRDGIVLYGIYPSKEVRQELPIKMALSWKAKISHIKEVPAGEGISYGSTFVTKRLTRVATIPVGYGDGYPRILSGKASVLVSGVRCPILGVFPYEFFCGLGNRVPRVYYKEGKWIGTYNPQNNMHVDAFS